MQSYFFEDQFLIEGDYKLSTISIETEIGQGNARVYAAHINQALYAIKQIQIKTDYEYHSFLKEISHLKEISQINQYLIGYQGYFITQLNKIHHARKKYAYIVMEYAQMNLTSFVLMRKSNPSILSIQMIELIIETLIKGFSELENINIAHCDIKPENILVTKYKPQKGLQLKICDVGSCKIVNSQSLEQLTIYGTLPFLAPQLIQMKSKKMISTNPFRSDVFSFGLVLLYTITGKKFNSRQRKQIQQETYEEILNQWMRQASQIGNNLPHISEILKESLEIDQFKRSTFKQLRVLYQSYKRKRKMETEGKINKLNSRYESEKQNTFDVNKVKSPVILTGGRTTTALTKRNRISHKFSSTAINKVRSNKRSPSNQSNKLKTTSSEFSLEKSKISNKPIDIGPIIYVSTKNQDLIPYDQIQQENSIFVVSSPHIKFKTARTVSILPKCPPSVFLQLKGTTGDSLHIDYSSLQDLQISEEFPMVDYQNIHINLENSAISGYNSLLRSLCPIFLKSLSLQLSDSQINMNDVDRELDRLKNREIRFFKLSWKNTILSQTNHSIIVEKISKLPLKDLRVEMNSNLIKYQIPERWRLPCKLTSLYLNYENNFMGNTLHNLVVSISNQLKLKELYLNFRNNNLNDIEIKLLFQTLSQYPHVALQKLVINVSMNPISKPLYTLDSLVESGTKSYFRNVMSLQLRLDECQIRFDDLIQIVKGFLQFFQPLQLEESKLRIVKLSCDRKIKKKSLQDQLSGIVSLYKYLKLHIVPYDNKFYMLYFQKKKSQSKNLIRKSIARPNLKNYKNDPKNKHSTFVCPRLYSNQPTYESFICLSCIQNRQLSKTQYFCKSCIEKCGHKGHSIVRAYQNKSCNCAYNYCCQNSSQRIQGQICSDHLGISYKKRYFCNKCKSNMCKVCIRSCNQNHEEWVDSYCSTYFACEGVVNSQHTIY